MKIFVTGTDTDVGKTLISSWLCAALKYDYWKPIQAGIGASTDSDVVRQLTGGAVKIYPETYRYTIPISPHEAARVEERPIVLETVLQATLSSKNLITEGAGGLLVPLNAKHFMIDLIKALEMPTLLVCSSRVGSINHTLLSLEVLKTYRIKVLAIVVNGPYSYNFDAIKFYATKWFKDVPVVSFPELDPEVIKPDVLKQILSKPLFDIL